MWFVRINMTDQSCSVEDAPAAYEHLAGRGLTSSLIADEVPPQCHPLGPNNKLVFSPGLVTGTAAPSSSRVSVGGKSPLTGGIKESNAGTSWAHTLASMQVKALVVEGQPKEKGQHAGVHLTWDAAAGKPAVRFFDASEYGGRDLSEVFPRLYERFGDRVAISGCGVAGELGYSNSGVVFND